MSTAVQAVIAVLEACQSPNNSVRTDGEEKLGMLEEKQGYVSTLLELIALDEVAFHTKQGAVLRLKNILKDWSFKERRNRRRGDNQIPVALHDDDRQIIKENIVEVIIFQSEDTIRVHLMQCLYYIAQCDFPNQYPEIIPQIEANLTSDETGRIYGALQSLRMVFKTQQFKPEEKRGVLFNLSDHCLPILQNLAKEFILGDTPEHHEMMRIIVKIFFIATQLSVPPCLQDEQALAPWMELLLQIFEWEAAPALQIDDQKKLKAQPFWKCKKWAALIANRIFRRYGRPNALREADSEDKKKFANMFWNAGYQNELMEAMLGILQRAHDGITCTHRVIQAIWLYLETAVGHASLWQVLKPNVSFLLFECCFPVLCLNEDDLREWEDEPAEYVTRQLDVLEEFEDPRVAAQNFLISSIRIRTNDTLMPTLEFVQGVLTEGKSDVIRREGALRMFGCMSHLLLSEPSFNDAIEQLLLNEILPDFEAPEGFLRSRAMWVAGKFCQLEFEDASVIPKLANTLADALFDDELPVQVFASLALRKFIQKREAEAVPAIRDKIPAILERFLSLIDEISSCELMETYSVLLEAMGEDVAEFAISIITRLSQLFSELIQAEDGDDQSAFTAINTLTAMIVILSQLENHPELYDPLEEILQPLLDTVLVPDGLEFLDEILQMLVCLTWYPKRISPFVWSLWPRLQECFHSWGGMDYFDCMLPLIDNYVSLDTDRFLGCQDPPYTEHVINMCATILQDDEKDTESQTAAKVFEVLLSHCHGRIDDYVPEILRLSIIKLEQTDWVALQLLLLDVIGVAAYYNPEIFLNVTETMGATQFVFNFWLSALENMSKSSHHQKLAILGLSSLLLLPVQSLPEQVRDALGQILYMLLQTLTTYREAIEKTGQAKEADSDDDDQEQNTLSVLQGLDDNEDVAVDDGTSGGMFFGGAGHRIEEEEVLFTTPLDEIDPFVQFAGCLHHFQTQEPEAYGSWHQSIPQSAQYALQQHLQHALSISQGQQEHDSKAA